MKVMLDNRLLSSCKTLLQCAEANSFLIFCGMYNYVVKADIYVLPI